LLKDKLAKKGGTKVKNSMRIFPKQYGLGIKELDQKLLGKPKRIYK